MGGARFAGTLRADARLARRFEDGAPAAVVSAAAGSQAEHDAACVSERAEHVWLETHDGAIELRGRIEVVGGRVTRLAGAPSASAWARVSAGLESEPDWPFTSLPVELRSVAAGDRVEVAGKLEHARDVEAAGYRAAARRILVPITDVILVQLAAPRAVRCWRAPLLAVIAFAIVNLGSLAEDWRGLGFLALANPLTRSEALHRLDRWVSIDAELALRDGLRWTPPSAVELARGIAPATSCAARARLLRASGAARSAFYQAVGCEGPEAGRERTLALFALGREEDAMVSWEMLLHEVDAGCAIDPACDLAPIELARSATHLEWGGRYPALRPREIFVGRSTAHRPHVAHRLHAMFETMELRSDPMRAARIEWTLELASMELALGQRERSRQLVGQAAWWLDFAELPGEMGRFLRRDLDHLSMLAAGDGHHPNDGRVPCLMQSVDAARRNPYSDGPDSPPRSVETRHRVRDAFVNPHIVHPLLYGTLESRETFTWVALFAGATRPAGIHLPVNDLVRIDLERRLRSHLGEPLTCDGSTDFWAAACDSALADAHEALGGVEQHRVRSCVRGARARLLARLPLEHVDGERRDDAP